jgi:hypothetical protein
MSLACASQGGAEVHEGAGLFERGWRALEHGRGLAQQRQALVPAHDDTGGVQRDPERAWSAKGARERDFLAHQALGLAGLAKAGQRQRGVRAPWNRGRRLGSPSLLVAAAGQQLVEALARAPLCEVQPRSRVAQEAEPSDVVGPLRERCGFEQRGGFRVHSTLEQRV